MLLYLLLMLLSLAYSAKLPHSITLEKDGFRMSFLNRGSYVLNIGEDCSDPRGCVYEEATPMTIQTAMVIVEGLMRNHGMKLVESEDLNTCTSKGKHGATSHTR